MSGRFRRVVGVIGVLETLLILIAWMALGGNTYINNFPDVEVTEPDCYSFDINVSQASGSSATLTVRVFDVDEESGELDEVFLNNVSLGYLSGTNDTWSTTSFDISSTVIYDDVNTVRVCIDPDGGEATTWRATIDWGQILVDGGSAEDADITSVSATGDWNAIQVATNVSATNSDTYRLEINLLDSTLNNKDIAVDTFAMTGGASTTRNNTVSLPSEPSGSETFTIEALLFNETTGIQQSVKTTTWTSASAPPTDIDLSNNSVDENVPALSLVGNLSATDPDSASHEFTLIGGDIASFTITGSELRTSSSFNHEMQATYNVHIQAKDDDENAISEWFTILVNDVNEAPTASDDQGAVDSGATLLIDVLSNDSDPDSDLLTVVSVSTPSQGSATRQPDDSILYESSPGACGTDSFSYTVEDGDGESSTALVTVTLGNGAPTALDDHATTPEQTPVLIAVLLNDSDPGGSDLSIHTVGSPLYGTATAMGADILYTPVPRFEGTDRFSYTLIDDCGASATAFVEVEVLHTNHPPTAHAGGIYQGVVGEPLELSASFSHDPDVGDFLQYRWDLNGSGIPNTDWLTSPIYTTIYEAPFFGEIILEVRDVYRGTPTGEVSTATALVRIASEQSIQVYVFEDLDGDGQMGDSEYGIPGITVEIGGEPYLTEADGGIGVELDTGSWDVVLPQVSVAALESRGFTPRSTGRTVELAMGGIEIIEIAVSKTSTKLKGVIYEDTNANGELDDADRRLPELLVMLDGDEDGLVVTDEFGAYAFREVAYGEHSLLIQEQVESQDQEPLSLLVPFSLTRTAKAEVMIAWPYDLGPAKGFLQVDVERGEGVRP